MQKALFALLLFVPLRSADDSALQLLTSERTAAGAPITVTVARGGGAEVAAARGVPSIAAYVVRPSGERRGLIFSRDPSDPHAWIASTVLTVSGLYRVEARAYASGGLQGFYFAGPSFREPAERAQTDGAIDFDWRAGSLASILGSDAASVRWVGAVLPPPVHDARLLLHGSGEQMRLQIDSVRGIQQAVTTCQL
jgi:hypothetical protein